MIVESNYNYEKCYLTHSISELVEAICYDKYNEEIDEEHETGHPSYILNNIVFSGFNITNTDFNGKKEPLVMFTIKHKGFSVPIYVSGSRNIDVILKPWETNLKENIAVCIRYGLVKMAEQKLKEMYLIIERHSKLYVDYIEIEKILQQY